jgi:hypothetical protein
MDKPAVQSLKTYLIDALRLQARGKRDFEVSVLRSQPKRSYALFPWASDPSIKIDQEHLLVVLAERHQDAAQR